MIWMLIATLCSQFVPIAEAETEMVMGTLLVDVIGFESSDGLATVCLFTQDEFGFPANPESAGFCVTEVITDLSSHFELDVPADQYVVMAFHDENSNGEFDMDEELMGFSGDLPQMSSSGQPPSFYDFSIDHSGTVTAARVTVRKMERPERGEGGPGGSGGPGGGGPGGGGGGGGRPF